LTPLDPGARIGECLSGRAPHETPEQEGSIVPVYERLAGARSRTVGTKQTLKALQKGKVRLVYVARDAEEKVVRDILRLSREKNVEVVYADSMVRLGQACGIHVGAATAAVLED